MKKRIVICLLLLVGVLALVACNTTTPKVTNAVINEKGELVLTYSNGAVETVKEVDGLAQNELENATVAFDEYKNLILTYPDGTTVSLGKNAMKEYTVKFVDFDGRVIAEKSVLAGLAATAPADPVREDYTFAGWDKAFTSVTSDMTVTATYTAKTAYTVTFVDYDDTVLKTESVISGKSATPPADPTRAEYNFAGWEGDYTNVTANITVKAKYTVKGTYTVTFVDYNGLMLGEVQVKEGKTATAPVTPTRDGYTFKGWSSSLTNIKANKTVTAEYTLIPADNVFDIAYKVSGNSVTLTLSLAGDVCLAGFEGNLTFDGMTATAASANSANATINLKDDGTISIAYAAAVNVTKGETVFTVTLTKTADNAKANLTIADCFDQDFETVSYKIIGETVKLK